MSDIAQQRREALAARRALTSPHRRTASRIACNRLTRLPVFRRARHIGIYWPLPSETDPRFVLEHLRPHQHVYLPRVHGKMLRFVAIGSDAFRHEHGAFGIVEPKGRHSYPATHLDLLIMPLAAFDPRAHRIGMGGGFYDRTLAYRTRGAPSRGPYLVGLALEAQRVDAIDVRPWDVALDAVVTEARRYRFADATSSSGTD